MKAEEPLVSVCVPVYNAEPYLEQTLRSVLGQSYANWELVIVENKSKDASLSTIERLISEEQDPRIRLHVNTTHLDMASNMNKALSLARGSFVKILCADDSLEPDCLAVQVAALLSHPSAALAACARRIINGRGRLLFKRTTFPRNGLINGKQAIASCLRAGTNLIGEPTMVLLRASSLHRIPWMDMNASYCVDLEFWIRLLERSDMVYTTQALASFRVHGKAATRQHAARMLEDFLRTAKRAAHNNDIPLGKGLLWWLRLKLPIQNAVRRLIYSWFGGS